MSIKSAVEGTILQKVVNNLAASEPKTTLLGASLGGLMLAQVDYGKLIQGDPNQIGTAIAAVIVAVIGYYTNHSSLVKAAK